MSEFLLPDLGEGLREAEIVAWHVAEGDHVVVDQPLVSVETEKAVVEIPSPKAGHIARLRASLGEHVMVGAPLVDFEDGPHSETGTVVGSLAGPKPMPSTPTKAASNGTVRASPAVRSRARELGVDLADIAPSGPDRTVTLSDVEAATAMQRPRSVQVLGGARRAMALNMIRAGREVVPAALFDDAEITHWSSEADVTVRLLRAIVAGCRAEPLLNSSFDTATLALQANSTIDIGLAIDSPEGLFVPVLRNLAASAPEHWRSRVDAAKSAVRDRKLAPQDLRNPTITLSNFGTIAGRHAVLVIVPPQVAILGAGRITEQPFGHGDRMTQGRRLPLSLTFDHRAVTGGEAARFLRAVMSDLELTA
jgi:2-oxoisovalerate dehydrogenase E2 component (dihydrolipoyl transacylase)